jgi:hypothetical protein
VRGIDGFAWRRFEFPIFGQRRREVGERVHGTECDVGREQKQTTLDEMSKTAQIFSRAKRRRLYILGEPNFPGTSRDKKTETAQASVSRPALLSMSRVFEVLRSIGQL